MTAARAALARVLASVGRHEAADVPLLGLLGGAGILGGGGTPGGARSAPLLFHTFDARGALVDRARAATAAASRAEAGAVDDAALASLLAPAARALDAHLAALTAAARGDPASAPPLAALAGAQRRLSRWHRRLGLSRSGPGGAGVGWRGGGGEGGGGETRGGFMASTAAVASAAEVGHGAVGALVGPRGPRGEKAWAEDVSGLSDRLDDLASRAFSPPRGDDPEAEAARARHLIAALFAPPRPADAADSATRTDRKPLPRPLRSEPTEFLYDGMDKVLIPSVLARAGGTPAGLAAVAAAVAARVAVPCAVLTPASARAAAAGMGGVGILGVGGADQGGAAFADPAAARLRARAAAYEAQGGDRWALRLGPRGDHAVFVDLQRPYEGPTDAEGAARALLGRGGPDELRTLSRAARDVGLVASSDNSDEDDGLNCLRIQSEGASGPDLWRSLVSDIVSQYQRRGLSDDVAAWLPSRCAMDVGASEWNLLLRG